MIVDKDKFCRCILCIVLDKCIFCGVVKYVFGYNIILKDVDGFLVVFGVWILYILGFICVIFLYIWYKYYFSVYMVFNIFEGFMFFVGR